MMFQCTSPTAMAWSRSWAGKRSTLERAESSFANEQRSL